LGGGGGEDCGGFLRVGAAASLLGPSRSPLVQSRVGGQSAAGRTRLPQRAGVCRQSARLVHLCCCVARSSTACCRPAASRCILSSSRCLCAPLPLPRPSTVPGPARRGPPTLPVLEKSPTRLESASLPRPVAQPPPPSCPTNSPGRAGPARGVACSSRCLLTRRSIAIVNSDKVPHYPSRHAQTAVQED